MIKQQNDKYFVHTKVKGVSGAKVPGSYFGFQGRAMAKIHAQPLIREMAVTPEIVDQVLISNMVIKVIIAAEEHPIGVLDRKYIELAKDKVITVKSYEITGYDASLIEGKEYIRLGVNISFEISKEQAESYITNHKKEILQTV